MAIIVYLICLAYVNEKKRLTLEHIYVNDLRPILGSEYV
jgi:hypothetical protein